MKQQIAQHTYSQTDDYTDEGEYDDVWPTRMPSSVRRYENVPTTFHRPMPQPNTRQSAHQVTPIQQRRSLAPRQGQGYIQPGTYSDGNTRLNVYQGAPPPAAGKKGRTTRDTEEPQTVLPKRRLHLLRGWRIHPILYLGIGMILMLALWVGLTSLISWGQWELNNLSYGYPRTYQIDGVINQNGDSLSNPTHIIFLNLNRKIEVIVQPAGDASKARIYVITTLLEAGSELFPVKGYVKDLGNGKPDIVVVINGSGRTALINTGTDFRLVQPSDNPNY